MFSSLGTRWRLGRDAGASPKEARGDDPRIVYDQEFIASEETGKFRKQPVFEIPGGAILEQET